MSHVLHKLLRSVSLCRSGFSLTSGNVRLKSDPQQARWKIFLAVMLLSNVLSAHAELSVLIVEGLGGEAKYQQQFDKEAKAIQAASAGLTSAERIQLLSGEGATRANITAVLKQFATSLNKEDRLAIYLIGHGSHDGYEYKFNIPGADISGTELARLLDAVKSESQLIVATGSSSGALQETLKKDSRVIVTATRNGNERNATQFGGQFADALTDATTDTDKNGRITVQEAFDLTARKVKDYFEAESKLSTEHAQLTGTRAGVFAIAQVAGVNAPVATTANAGLLAQREQINSQLEDLRLRKESLSEDDYLKQLEPLLLQMAELDARIEAEGSAAGVKP